MKNSPDTDKVIQSFSLFASFFMEFADIKRAQLGVLSPEMEAMYRQAKAAMELLESAESSKSKPSSKKPDVGISDSSKSKSRSFEKNKIPVQSIHN